LQGLQVCTLAPQSFVPHLFSPDGLCNDLGLSSAPLSVDKISNEIHNSRNLGTITVTAQTSMLHIRVDDDIKEQATQALTAMGMSVSDAVRLFLRRVVIDQAFPLELKVPNAETLAAMEESRAMMTKRRAGFASADELFADLEKNSSK
jgi:DNA-damage-inducible protein J